MERKMNFIAKILKWRGVLGGGVEMIEMARGFYGNFEMAGLFEWNERFQGHK
jgi:hypothetical protein